MKDSTKDKAQGKLHEVKGAIKEQAGKVSANPDLEDDGTIEKVGGKIQQAIGKVEKAVGA